MDLPKSNQPPTMPQSRVGYHPKILHSILNRYGDRGGYNVDMTSEHGPTGYRERSGSLGSTGSSVRESYSPSAESASPDIMSHRGSPLSLGSSPSPSPPTLLDSKLFGILRGTVTSPYGPYLASSASRSTSPAHSNGAYGCKRHCEAPPSDDQPIDLSCKKQKPCSNKAPEPISQSPQKEGSILQAILCGRTSGPSGGHFRYAYPTSCPRDKTRSSTQASPLEKPTPCPLNKRVTLAKKILLPINARVSDWLYKSVAFARSQPEFASLPSHDKLILVLNAWSRLLLLFMAENNFHFAVTSMSGENQAQDELVDASVPTNKSVESIQSFIRKCQSMNLDTEEFHFMKMATLFHTGYGGLENADFLEKVNSYVRGRLQEHLQKSRPNEKLRYSSVLLSVHSLFGINCKMVENLFCKHVVKDADMEVLLKEMLLSYH